MSSLKWAADAMGQGLLAFIGFALVTAPFGVSMLCLVGAVFGSDLRSRTRLSLLLAALACFYLFLAVGHAMYGEAAWTGRVS